MKVRTTSSSDESKVHKVQPNYVLTSSRKKKGSEKVKKESQVPLVERVGTERQRVKEKVTRVLEGPNTTQAIEPPKSGRSLKKIGGQESSARWNHVSKTSSEMIEEYKKDLLENGSIDYRALAEYIKIFGNNFENTLFGLGKSNHLLESGAGEGKFINGYIDKMLGNGVTHNELPKTTLVEYDKEQYEDSYRNIKSKNPNVIIKTGKLLEELSIGSLGRADVIVDVHGPMDYTLSPDVVLLKYGEILRPGGKLFLNVSLKSMDLDAFKIKTGKMAMS